MKVKSLICAIALFAVAVAASAETHWGVVAGANINKLRVEKESLDPKAGFHVGLLIDKQLIGNLHIQPSIVFTQRGAKAEIEEEVMGVTMTSESDVKLNYLQVPIEASYRMPLGPISLDFIAGPYLAWGLNGEVETESSTSVAGIASDVKATYKNIFKEGDDGEEPLYKRFDTGVRLGLGTHVGSHLGVSLYYDLGFVKLDKQDIKDEFASKNGSFLISASFTF